MRKVWDVKECCYDEYDEEWFNNVNMEGAEEFELSGRKIESNLQRWKRIILPQCFWNMGKSGRICIT